MGTRNLIAVMFNNEYKIAQYSQWDGYPSGQGKTALNFLKIPGNIDKLKSALKKVRFLDSEGQDKKFLEEYEKNCPTYIGDPDPRTEDQLHWFNNFISRDLGADILDNVSMAEDEEIVLRNSIEFAGDSLFCEWGYVVDLDKNTFEVYSGFNKDPVENARFVTGDKSLKNEGGYEPIALMKIYKLDQLPSDESFLADFEEDEEE